MPKPCLDGGAATAMALCLALSACALAPPLDPPAPPAPRAELARYRHEVVFRDGQTLPSAEASASLDDVLDRLGPTPDLAVRLTARGDDGGAAARQRLAAVASRVRARLPEARIATSIADADGRAASVLLAAEGWVLRSPVCPDWSRDPTGDTRNRPLSNLGCATARNLGLMVVDLEELERGTPLAPADGAHEADSVVRYRSDKVKAIQSELGQP